MKKLLKVSTIIYILLGVALIYLISFLFNLNNSKVEKVYNYKIWEIEFSKPLSQAELSKQNIEVVDSKDNRINTTITWTSNNVVDVNPPKGGYNIGETYALKVDSAIAFTIENKKLKVKKFSIKEIKNAKQIVTFADKNLERAVRNVIKKPEGNIYVSDVENITTLIATSSNISNLSGIENLINLHMLCIDVNQISDISYIKDLTDLQVLGLSHNQIQDVSKLKNLINLKRLSLHGNPIKNINTLNNISKQLEWKDF